MTEETEIKRSDPAMTQPEGNPVVKAERSRNERARTEPPTNRWSIRRAELKRQKRRAHRRRINASNRPG
jgi:hypothetical protein